MSVNIVVIPKKVMDMMMSTFTEKSSLTKCVVNAVRKQQIIIFHGLRNTLMGWMFSFELVKNPYGHIINN